MNIFTYFLPISFFLVSCSLHYQIFGNFSENDEEPIAIIIPQTPSSALLPTTFPEPLKPAPTFCPRVIFRHSELKGIGYDKGYTTLEGLFIFAYPQKNLWPLINIRGHVFNNKKLACNAGGGLRWFFNQNKTVFGCNVFYDYRHHENHHFHQIGVGMEMLWNTLDIILNGYFPLNGKELLFQCFFNNYIDGYFISQKKYKVALTGANLEFKVNLDESFIAFGPYYFQKTACVHSFGGKVRLHINLGKYFNFGKYFYIEGNCSYDDIFKTRGQILIAFSYPFRCPLSKNVYNNQQFKPIERHEIIPLKKFCRWRWNY